jgi:hypothetical protein
MTQLRSLILSACLLSAVSGCKDNTSPPPRHADLPDAPGSAIFVADRGGDQSIIASAEPLPPEATADGNAPAPTPTPSPTPGVAGDIDQSSPEAVIQTYIQSAKAQNLSILPRIVIPAQRDLAKQMIEPMSSLIRGSERFLQLVEAQFPGSDLAAEITEKAGPGTGLTDLTLIEIQPLPEDPDRAQAVVQDAKGDAEELEFKRINGQWFITLPDMPTDPAQIEQAKPMIQMMGNMGQALNEISDQIETGQLTDEASVKEALDQAMEKAMAPMIEIMMQGMNEAMQNMESSMQGAPENGDGATTFEMGNENAQP